MTDNKYISPELIAEKDDLKERDYDKYLWVWEGHCLKVLDGAVYKDEMRKMREDGRITNVPYESSKPVYTFWDLGFGIRRLFGLYKWLLANTALLII